MGWSIRIKLDKNISEQEIDNIVMFLPQELSSPFGNRKTSWGWSGGTDIALENNNVIYLSGSYSMSGQIAESTLSFFKSQLKKQGYKVRSKKNW